MTSSHSPIIRVGVRAASPLAIAVGTYLLFAGHNNPGGGFAAGLVFGAVVTLRTVTGLQQPAYAPLLVAGGIIVVCLVAAAPLAFGNPLLDQEVWSVKMPLLGKVKSGSAFIFDIGVTAIVVGAIIALLNGFGPIGGEPATEEAEQP